MLLCLSTAASPVQINNSDKKHESHEQKTAHLKQKRKTKISITLLSSAMCGLIIWYLLKKHPKGPGPKSPPAGTAAMDMLVDDGSGPDDVPPQLPPKAVAVMLAVPDKNSQRDHEVDSIETIFPQQRSAETSPSKKRTASRRMMPA